MLGYIGITPTHYHTGKKVWKSKPLRKTRTRTKRWIRKYLKYVAAALLVYYFIKKPADFQIMTNHLVGVLMEVYNRVAGFVVQNLG